MGNQKETFDTFYMFELKLSPIGWLKAVFSAIKYAFYLPSRVIGFILNIILALVYLANNNKVGLIKKVFVICVILFLAIFWQTPKNILYTIVKLVLVCFLIEFNIVRRSSSGISPTPNPVTKDVIDKIVDDNLIK